MVGGGYSNRTRATQFNPTGMVRKYPNLQKKKIYVPELKKSFNLVISTRGLKTIQKNGKRKMSAPVSSTTCAQPRRTK